MTPTAAVRTLPLMIALLLGGVSSARAEPEPAPSARDSEARLREARAHVRKGQQFYEEEAFEGARAEFQRAYDQSGSYKILYNLALVSVQLHDFATAYQNYERYLHDGGAQIPEERAAEVQKALDALRQRVALVHAGCNVDGAEITVDDRVVGAAPLSKPVMVNPGEHKIGARKKDYQPAYRHVSLTASEASRVRLELAPVAERTVFVTRAAEPRSKPVWLYWAPAALLAGGTAALGGLTLSAESDLDSMRARPTDDPDALAAQATRTKTLALATDIAGGATVVAAAVGLVLTLKGTRSESVAHGPRTSGPNVAVGAGSLSMSGEF